MQETTVDGKYFMRICDLMKGKKHDYAPIATMIAKVDTCILDELFVLAQKYHPLLNSLKENECDIWKRIQYRVQCMEREIKIDKHNNVYFE